MMWKRKTALFLACLLCVAGFSACSFKSGKKPVEKTDSLEADREGQEKKEDAQETAGGEQEQVGFTEEELSADYLEKDVSDRFQIQGTITPKPAYEDGVGIYRIKLYGTAKGEQRMTVPIKRAAVAFPGIEPDWESLEKTGDTAAELPFQETGSQRTGKMVSGEEYFQFLYGSFQDVVPYKNSIVRWNNYVPQKEKEDLPFLSMEEAAGKVKDIIEALTDAEVSEAYTGQSFPENPAGTIREYYYGGQQEGKDDDFAGSFYYFLFYFSKDGIKLDDLVFNFPLDDRVSYPKTVGINRKENTIYVRGEPAIEAIYAEDGLLYLNLPEIVKPLELYDIVQVLSLEDMAEKLDSYFESQLGMPKATVTSMELKYDTTVSDPDEDGKVMEIIKPYWVVEYYDQRKTTSQVQKYYGWSKAVFDAQTGEFLKQASPVA